MQSTQLWLIPIQAPSSRNTDNKGISNHTLVPSQIHTTTKLGFQFDSIIIQSSISKTNIHKNPYQYASPPKQSLKRNLLIKLTLTRHSHSLPQLQLFKLTIHASSSHVSASNRLLTSYSPK